MNNVIIIKKREKGEAGKPLEAVSPECTPANDGAGQLKKNIEIPEKQDDAVGRTGQPPEQSVKRILDERRKLGNVPFVADQPVAAENAVRYRQIEGFVRYADTVFQIHEKKNSQHDKNSRCREIDGGHFTFFS